ncbi:MAG: hypothetical protein RR319_07450 [Bacteroides sp.]
MKQFFSQLLNVLTMILPFLRRKDAAQLTEFTALVQNQFDYLVEKVEKFQQEYIHVMEQVQQLLTEIASLKASLQKSEAMQCHQLTCTERN